MRQNDKKEKEQHEGHNGHQKQVLGAVLGAIIVLCVAAATPNSAPLEYKVVAGSVVDNHINKVLNSHIADGWEFVSASHHAEREVFIILRRTKK